MVLKQYIARWDMHLRLQDVKNSTISGLVLFDFYKSTIDLARDSSSVQQDEPSPSLNTLAYHF